MARSTLNIETAIEDAFVRVLSGEFVDLDVAVTRWDDIRDKELTPLVKIKASTTSEEPGTINLFSASRVIVDFGIFTSKREDEDGRVANSIMGDVRAMLYQTDIVTLLNITEGLLVYNNGVMPRGSADLSDERNWHKAVTVEVVATTN